MIPCSPPRVRRARLSCILLSFLLASISSSRGGGVTLITHGFNSDVATWIIPMAGKITTYGSLRGTNTTCYEISVTKSGSTYNTAVSLIAGSPPLTTDSGEIILKLDWSTISATLGVSTLNIATAAAAALQSTNLIPALGGRALVELPLHLIGHSRGGSVVTETARLLGAQGIWVDHVTTLDPRPVSLLGDPSMKNYANILFADNYWQDMGDGVTVPNGQSLPGAYNRHLLDLDGGYDSSHSDVHLWYHGTIELETPASDTQASITSAERLAWWTPPEAAGTNAGFYYSLLGGGDRFSTNEPAGPGTGRIRDGFNQTWDLGAGVTNTRSSLPADNGAWPNLLRLDVAGTNRFSVDEPLALAFYDQFGSNTSALATAHFYLDLDSNPYDTNEIPIDSFLLSGTGTGSVAFNTVSIALDPTNTPPGAYRVLGRIEDGLHARYLYAPQSLVIDPSRRAPVLLDPVIQSGQFQFTVLALPGQSVIVQDSLDLVQWTGLSTNQVTATGTSFNVVVQPDLNLPQHFYRAVLGP